MSLIRKLFPQRFDKFWKKIDQSKFSNELVKITNSFLNSKSYRSVSNQWHVYNISHYRSLLKNSTKKLGTEVFNHYFNFFEPKDEYLLTLNKFYDKKIFSKNKKKLQKKHSNLDLKKSLSYNKLLLLLFLYLKKTKYITYLSKLRDKTFLKFGNPFIKIENVNITSDKIISLFDLEKIEQFHNIKKKNFKILEIGAGSGRLADCILSIRKNIKYTICDIPPAIFISFKRLKNAFPKKKIKILINIEQEEQLLKELEKNDICFIFPHQLEKINKYFFNLVLAVDCFHEMDKKTLKYYFSNLTKISNRVYFSIWKKTKNWYSGSLFKKTERLDFDKGDYPIPKNWKNTFKKSQIFPSNYYALGYKILK